MVGTFLFIFFTALDVMWNMSLRQLKELLPNLLARNKNYFFYHVLYYDPDRPKECDKIIEDAKRFIAEKIHKVTPKPSLDLLL